MWPESGGLTIVEDSAGRGDGDSRRILLRWLGVAPASARFRLVTDAARSTRETFDLALRMYLYGTSSRTLTARPSQERRRGGEVSLALRYPPAESAVARGRKQRSDRSGSKSERGNFLNEPHGSRGNGSARINTAIFNNPARFHSSLEYGIFGFMRGHLSGEWSREGKFAFRESIVRPDTARKVTFAVMHDARRNHPVNAVHVSARSGCRLSLPRIER